MAKCKIPGCGREAVRRGQCKSCVRATEKLVEDGKTTWAAVEKKGLANPVRRQLVREALGLPPATKPKKKRNTKRRLARTK